MVLAGEKVTFASKRISTLWQRLFLAQRDVFRYSDFHFVDKMVKIF